MPPLPAIATAILIQWTNSGIGGFLLAATPLSCDLMGWRGAGGNGAATTYVLGQPYS